MSEGRIARLSDLQEGESYTIGSLGGVVDITVVGVRPDGIVNCRLTVVESPESHELFDGAQDKPAQLVAWVSGEDDCPFTEHATRSLPFKDTDLLMIYMRNTSEYDGASEHQSEFLGPDCAIIARADTPPDCASC